MRIGTQWKCGLENIFSYCFRNSQFACLFCRGRDSRIETKEQLQDCLRTQGHHQAAYGSYISDQLHKGGGHDLSGLLYTVSHCLGRGQGEGCCSMCIPLL